VRVARVKVEVNGQPITLTSGNYNLPVMIAGVQVDCPITRGYNSNSGEDSWALVKDARLRLWAAGWPLVKADTFVYPLKQCWFASGTQMANEPVHVDGGEVPKNKKIYYHNDLDFGGCEGMVDVVAATDGLVVSAAKVTLPGYEDTPVRLRYDVVYVLDECGWYYRYSHLFEIDPAIRPGAKVKMGQKIGVLGKEGASGGWSHLHFGIKCRMPSGKWGTQEAYAFAWEAYMRQYQPKIVAVARPHQYTLAGEKVILDGSKSWSAAGKIARYEWTFGDGTTASSATAERCYTKPGTYSEILKVTGRDGAIGYDFAVVQIADKAHLDQLLPSIHAAYAPSLNVKAGQPVTFKVRTFRTTHGEETWDFGDSSPRVVVKSDGNVKALAKDGFAITEHRFAKAGDYIVSVERSNERGEKATAHLYVQIEE
jgi:murein DD-endopeptidase MepM/ murein hydrolase activator NlpD